MQNVKYKKLKSSSYLAVFSFISLFLFPSFLFAGSRDTAYARVALGRAEKIVGKMEIKNEKTKNKVIAIVADQYVVLNDIYKERDSLKTALKKNMDSATTVKLDIAHKSYIKRLSKYLSEDKITEIKDGMTYGVVPLTYNAYLDMLPMLTEEQKKQMYAWLVEAREHAMDAESSDKKHAWFGKYKGRINNYLSAAGIDMNAEGVKWQKRIAEKNKNSHN